MVYLLFVVFSILAALTIFDLVKTRYKDVLFIGFGILLILISGFRPVGIDRDYMAYVDFYNDNVFFSDAIVEPSFKIISLIVHHLLFNKPVFLFLIYAILGITTKLVSINQLSDFKFSSLLIYFSYLYTLQDMTQIRAGVAVGFLLLCIKPLYERRFIKFFIFALLAILFHYSAAVALPLWFIDTKRINKWFYVCLVPAVYFMHFTGSFYITTLINYLPSGPILMKFLAYEADNGATFNVLNSWQLLRCALAIFMIVKADDIYLKNRYAILLIKIYCISTVVYVLLALSPVFATRISDLFAASDIIVIPYVLYLFRPKYLALFFIATIASLYLILNLIYLKIIM